jgi:Amt family ammonium transporter
MTPATAPNYFTSAFCLFCILLIPCAIAGLALINAGLGRSKNVAHSLLASLCVASVAALVYFAYGEALQGYPGRPERVFTVGGKTWSWIGAGRPLMRGIACDGSAYSLAVPFGMFAAALAAVIPLGAAAERWRLGASCASAALLSGLSYPLFAHWAWGGGWLAQLGSNAQMGRGFVDSGGAGSVQAVGGLTALAITWLLGPRRGKYEQAGMPAAFPAHNAGFVLFGSFLTWVGYIGLNCAGAVLFSGLDALRAALAPLNVTLSAATALLMAAAASRARFGKADASLCANAWVAGLVASSAGCVLIRPAGAVLAGALAGTLVIFAVGWLEWAKVDDPGGAISVHGLGGLWGLLAVGLFQVSGDPSGERQWVAQVAGIATLLGFVLPVAYGANRLLDRFLPQRAAPEAERQGLDLYELGAGAYPDFMIHREE